MAYPFLSKEKNTDFLNDFEDVEMKCQLMMVVLVVHWMLLDRIRLTIDYGWNFFVFHPNDRKHREELLKINRFCHVSIYSMKNFCHIANTLKIF